MNLKTIYATREDIPDICEAAKELFAESNFSELTLDIERYADILDYYVEQRDIAASILCVDDRSGFILGYIHIYYAQDYTVERIGEIFQFFVRKDYRGTKAARMLIASALRWYESKDCVRAYFDADPGFDDGGKNIKLVRNLLAKFDYVPTGHSFQVDLRRTVDGRKEQAERS